MCLFHAPRGGAVLHDEFNGASRASSSTSVAMTLTVTIVPPFRAIPRPAIAAMLLVLSGAGAARAADVSAWDGDARSALRLIAGAPSSVKADPLRAGIEIRLKAGWHTYWRYPGDAGVPPRFDFSGSQNVKSVEVLWPAPRRLSEAGLDTIGYDRDLILPLRVTPQDSSKPVTLELKADYAICEKLCVPAQAQGKLALAGGSASQNAALEAAEARVPHKAALGAGEALAIRAIRREDSSGKPYLLVDVAAPAGTALDLFAEGPTADWSLPLPAPADGAAAGLKRFTFELDGAPPGAKYEGADLTLTAVTDGRAIEVPIHLD
jgi:DsbC/DsbD-like thiol-disulfide interchange protein